MLQPREIQRPKGFPDEYETRETKTETTEQIGNAVPVTWAQRLVESLLLSSEPVLTDYIYPEPVTVETGRSSVASDDRVILVSMFSSRHPHFVFPLQVRGIHAIPRKSAMRAVRSDTAQSRRRSYARTTTAGLASIKRT